MSFVDFAPTVLSLAGLPIPQYMQGMPFLGPHSGKTRRYVFAIRDRVDEVYEVSRAVRDEQFLYIRNFMPHRSWMQPERYSDNSGMRRELFPALRNAYETWRHQQEFSVLADPVQRGADHWLQTAREMLALAQQQPADLTAELERLVSSARL